MREAKWRNICPDLVLMALVVIGIAVPASVYAVDETTVWVSSGGGGDPLDTWGNLTRDNHGNLYGTSLAGGKYTDPFPSGDGTVFKLIPPATDGGSWTERVLWNFGRGPGGVASDGVKPFAGVTIDPKGNLYGTTQVGGVEPNGAPGLGTIFELMPPTAGNNVWTESVLHTFLGGPDGSFPMTALVMDKNGNLYGTTSKGGIYNSAAKSGTVFELQPPSTTGGAWTKTILWNFGNDLDASVPETLLLDNSGNLYGTAAGGGTYGSGAVFELIKPSSSASPWTESILWSFGNGVDGRDPGGSLGSPLLIDQNGNLFGTTALGGLYDQGTVFELTPPAITGGTWTESILWNFGGYSTDVLNPTGVIMDPHGNLLGTASYEGAVFELTPPASSGSGWTESILWSFGPGANNAHGPILDPQGNLFAATANGVVFELSDFGD